MRFGGFLQVAEWNPDHQLEQILPQAYSGKVMHDLLAEGSLSYTRATSNEYSFGLLFKTMNLLTLYEQRR